MDNTKPSNQNNPLGTALKWGVGGWIVWNLLPPESKDNILRWLYELSTELAVAQRRKADQEKQQRFLQSVSESFQKQKFSLTLPQSAEVLLAPSIEPNAMSSIPDSILTPPKSGINTKIRMEPDSIWLKRIIHPSIVLILGKRGSGKSALAYRLLELFRYGPRPYVVGVPASKRNLIPEWMGIASSLEEVPPGAIAIIDEAYLPYHARSSTAQESKEMSKLINLSRQKDQTIIFVTQEARQVDKNIASSANVIIFKDLGMLQLQFERPEFNHLATQAKQAFAPISGDKRRWSYLYAPDTDFSGLIENELPSFWKPSLSRMFAGEVSTTSKPRVARRLTVQEKVQKAKELRKQDASYADIAQALGVTRGTVLNYVRGYPYRK
jgi:hypothetical protein